MFVVVVDVDVSMLKAGPSGTSDTVRIVYSEYDWTFEVTQTKNKNIEQNLTSKR